MPRFKSNWPFLLEWEVVPDLKKFMKYSVSFKKTRIIEVKTRIIEVLQTPGYNVSSRKVVCGKFVFIPSAKAASFIM